jgi:hypothetical protein
VELYIETDGPERLNLVKDGGLDNARLGIVRQNLFGAWPSRIGDPVGESALDDVDEPPDAGLG